MKMLKVIAAMMMLVCIVTPAQLSAGERAAYFIKRGAKMCALKNASDCVVRDEKSWRGSTVFYASESAVLDGVRACRGQRIPITQWGRSVSCSDVVDLRVFRPISGGWKIKSVVRMFVEYDGYMLERFVIDSSGVFDYYKSGAVWGGEESSRSKKRARGQLKSVPGAIYFDRGDPFDLTGSLPQVLDFDGEQFIGRPEEYFSGGTPEENAKQFMGLDSYFFYQ